MPRKVKKGYEDEKKATLTLAQLAAYDDVATDALIDQAHWLDFREPIRKNRGNKYFAIRIPDEAVPKILLKQLINSKEYEQAEKSLRAIPGVKRYRTSLRTKWEKDQFRRHFRKYIDMYKTDCPFEVSTTNRYTITSYEAAITARKRIKQGDTIKYLTGTLVPLTADESADLDLTQRNFSIVVSSRKKNGSIFLGPARFANHDCNANGRLIPTGNDGMEVRAMKNIEVGEEITVTYGDDYFGPNNEDCLCASCEKSAKNGWTSAAAFGAPRSTASTPAMDDNARAFSTRQPPTCHSDMPSERSAYPSPSPKQKQISSALSKLSQEITPPTSPVPDSNLENQPPFSASSTEPISTSVLNSSTTGSVSLSKLNRPRKRSRLDQQISATELAAIEPVPFMNISATVPEDANRPRKRPRLIDLLTSSPASTTPSGDEAVRSSSSEASAGESHDTAQSTDATSLSDMPVAIKVENTEVTKIEHDEDTIIVDLHVGSDSTPLSQAAKKEVITPGSSLSDPSETHSFEDTIAPPPPYAATKMSTTIVTRMPSSCQPSILPSVESATTKLTVRPFSDTIRVPGDHILTPKLLAQPHDRWVQCRTCEGCFVQGNGYQTRRECPRCERHSKLYGFSWPKTDPDPRVLAIRKGKEIAKPHGRSGKSGKGSWTDGPGDPEVRVLDHRTVHRFVQPEAEREVTKRGLLEAAQRARNEGGVETPERLLEGLKVARGESLAMEGSGSQTPDGRRRSRRFVTGDYVR